MNNISATTSDSLVGSLCREVYSIRCRSEYVIKSIQTSKNVDLCSRLDLELKELDKRRKEVLSTAENLIKEKYHDTLSLEFLIELSRRYKLST